MGENPEQSRTLFPLKYTPSRKSIFPDLSADVLYNMDLSFIFASCLTSDSLIRTQELYSLEPHTQKELNKYLNKYLLS